MPWKEISWQNNHRLIITTIFFTVTTLEIVYTKIHAMSLKTQSVFPSEELDKNRILHLVQVSKQLTEKSKAILVEGIIMYKLMLTFESNVFS